MNIQIPLIDLRAQYARIKTDIDSAIQRVLDSATFVLGEEVERFERSFAEAAGAKGAVAVSSGTAALKLGLLALGVKSGDEVITPANTFIATIESIAQTGARPVFVDIDPRTYNIDPNRVEQAITDQTRAIVAVHLYGNPADMTALGEIAKRRGLWLVEDAAQAHAATYDGRPCGGIGDIGCFSFYPSKNLGAYGDAGAVTSNDEMILARVRQLRDHGSASKYEHAELGFCARMDALQAAVLNVKLPHLETWTRERRDRARLYNELLAETSVITPVEASVITPFEAANARHAYHLYVIRVALTPDDRPLSTDRRPLTTAPRPLTTAPGPPATAHRSLPSETRPPATAHRPPTTAHRPPASGHQSLRDQVLEHLRSAGIGAAVHYPIPVHLQPACVKLGWSCSLPVTERIASEVISLPMYPELTDEQLGYVVSRLKEFCESE